MAQEDLQKWKSCRDNHFNNLPKNKMIPLGIRVFIEPVIEEKRGSIVLARMSREMPSTGVVKAIAPKASEQTGVKVGDKVFFDKHYQELSEDQKTTIVEAKYLLAVLP